jgi:hypothetical protein
MEVGRHRDRKDPTACGFPHQTNAFTNWFTSDEALATCQSVTNKHGIASNQAFAGYETDAGYVASKDQDSLVHYRRDSARSLQLDGAVLQAFELAVRPES